MWVKICLNKERALLNMHCYDLCTDVKGFEIIENMV